MLENWPGAIGADEAGRGCLAGPVFAAAVWIPEGVEIRGLNDSKKLSPASRQRVAGLIRESAVFEIEAADPAEIDRLNILHASEAAISRAVNRLVERCPEAKVCLVDGNRIPPGMRLPGRAEVKGDGRWAAIAAASVLAKTARDAFMTELALSYPGYGFERDFGYPTPSHLEALSRLGPCEVHRRTFGPVAQARLELG